MHESAHTTCVHCSTKTEMSVLFFAKKTYCKLLTRITSCVFHDEVFMLKTSLNHDFPGMYFMTMSIYILFLRPKLAT
jgi:hypothetical protein